MKTKIEKNNNVFDLNANTINILLGLIFLMTAFNGCQSCSNRNAIKKTRKDLEKSVKTVRQENINNFNFLSKIHSTNAMHLKDVIEINSEAVIMIEKEIDNDARLKPTEIKKMFKQHRDYASDK